MKYAAAKNFGIIIMEPLRGGNLGNPEPPPPVAEIFKEAKEQRSPVEWALRWIWNHPEVTAVLSGMNEESHIEENLRIAEQAYPNSLNLFSPAGTTEPGFLQPSLWDWIKLQIPIPGNGLPGYSQPSLRD